jgi:two-component system, chemotaxis family, CheB/CheR fusion protein
MKKRTVKKEKKTAAKAVKGKKTPGSNSKTAPKPGKIKSFPIVAIGGSAGGMEAFSTLLQSLPADLGMSYIYIQHLSSDHKSMLPQILQRKTKMPVVPISNNTPLQKNHVYVIPAKNLVTINNGKLQLQPAANSGGMHPIDHFLTSLAPLYKQNAVGIILSGTGSDGTLGLMAIKAEGGITFAQDNTANQTGMPHHAADMGHVDFVMPPDKIAKELASLIKHPYAVTTKNEFLAEHKGELRKIHMLMNNRKGVDFSHYKQTTIHRRIMRRMALNRLKTVEEYLTLLRESKTEIDALYQDLLICVTDFFRDPDVYKALSDRILPDLLKSRKPTDPFRIWIPGCATGEEAVSFAITLLEYLGEKALATPIQIFATDLNERAIEKARAGIYLKTALLNVSPQRLRRFFVKTDGHFQVAKVIRDMCIFAPHNLLKDPPFSRMDVISCQNLLIYLESAQQNRIMHAFHYALKPTGYLLLGKSETIGSAIDLFDQASKQFKIYTKRLVTTPLQLDFSIRKYSSSIGLVEEFRGHDNGTLITEPDIEKETDKLLLSRYVPASVLVNKDLEILRFRGSTSRYLEPASGKASLHLLKMIREELAFDLRTVIHRAKKDNNIAKKEGIILVSDGVAQEITIEVIPFRSNGKDPFYLIVFKDRPVSQPTVAKKSGETNNHHGEKRIHALESQLKEARESIRIITEDFEATREELQSANEEILSSNEELQSINEELETSKEELQSTNEELTTINEELQIRNTELRETSDYAKAIVETMHESLIMLGGDLKVRTANKGFYQTFHATPEETEGVFLYDLGNGQWNIPELRKNLKLVQTRDIPFYNFEVTHDFPGIGEKSILLNAHKFSRKNDNDSLILLAVQDLTERKKMEDTLKSNEERFRLLVQNASDIITVFDQDGTIKYESPAIEPLLGYKPEDRVGRNLNMDPIVHPEDRNIKMDLFRTAIDSPSKNIYGEFRLRHKNGSYRTIDAIFRNLLHDSKINGIIATYRDISERKILEHQKDEFIGIASHELKTPVTSIKGYTQILEKMFSESNDKQSTELLGKLNTQIDRLTNLIVDLLDFTRIENGKLKFREEEYDINGLINEVTDEIQRSTSTHTIVKKLARPVIINGDRYRTGQVLTNLLSNAIKYSPGGKKVIVSSKIEPDKIIISVQDFGIGIEPELVDKVFDRFFRITESSYNTFSGLGLGLYIAAAFIKRQGGTIQAKSSKNKGSTFSFSLPLNQT